MKLRFLKLLSSWRLVVAIYLALFIPLFRPVVSVVDPVGYYSWARSLLIEGDLNVANEFVFYGMDRNAPTTPTGYLHNQWATGSALIWLPSMVAVHGVIVLLTQLGMPIAADGYSWPYVWAASLTSTLTGLGAVLLSYSLSRRLFGNFVSLLAAITFWLASPLVFYQYHQPLMSHANDAWLTALFMLTWWNARRYGRKLAPRLGLGLVIGAAVWVRPQNVILLLVILVEAGWDLVMGIRGEGWKTSTTRACVNVITLLAGFAFLFAPLMLFWREVYGAWLVNTYQTTQGGIFDWRASHLLEVLLSTDRGLLIWTPVTLPCIIGMKWLYRADHRLALLLSSIALLHLYVISSWSAWSGGDAFGPRFWIVLTPFFTLGLAALLDHISRTNAISHGVTVGLSGLFIVWNFLLMLQYSLGIVAPSGPVDLGRMVKNQFGVASHLTEQVITRLNTIGQR